MSDGANIGVKAGRAIETILGGKPPPGEDEQMGEVQFEEYIRTAPLSVLNYLNATGYSDAAAYLARLGLEFAEAHTEIDWSSVPAEDEYSELPKGLSTEDSLQHWIRNTKPIKEGFSTIWDRLDHSGYRAMMDAVQPSGFQYGWAVNAIYSILKLLPVSNPAIISINFEGEL